MPISYYFYRRLLFQMWIIFFFFTLVSLSIVPRRPFNADNSTSVDSAYAVPDQLLMWACHSLTATYSLLCDHLLSRV